MHRSTSKLLSAAWFWQFIRPTTQVNERLSVLRRVKSASIPKREWWVCLYWCINAVIEVCVALAKSRSFTILWEGHVPHSARFWSQKWPWTSLGMPWCVSGGHEYLGAGIAVDILVVACDIWPVYVFWRSQDHKICGDREMWFIFSHSVCVLMVERAT
jgi:hypothetical protein